MDLETLIRGVRCVITLYQSEVALSEEVKQKRKKLVENLSYVENKLKCDVEDQLLVDPRERRMRDINDAIYKLIDILEDCPTEVIRESEKCFTFLLSLDPRKAFSLHNIRNRMKDAEACLKTIGLEDNNADGNPEKSAPGQNTQPTQRIRECRRTKFGIGEDEFYTIENEVEGRREDVDNILWFLLENRWEKETPFVLPIVGMGGLGKTTLAKLVYKRLSNEETTSTPFFHPKPWVWVGENFDEKTLLKGIIASDSDHKSNNEIESEATLDDLKKKLKNVLGGKRYLLVLDDVWIDVEEKWEQVKNDLKIGLEGSCVLVTTRQRKVAEVMAPHKQTYYLGTLPVEHSRKVFSRHAFGSQVPQAGNLVKLGEQIVDKCKGVPLAVKTVASSLRGKEAENLWCEVKDTKNWKPKGREDPVFAALRLCYLNLPPNLRRCFSYCAIFPKGYEIKKEELIHLWMAHGLISSEGREVENVGEEKLQDLYSRSLIEDVVRDEWGNVYSFKMHDLVHDLALSIMEECYVINEPVFRSFPSTTRHLSINYEIQSTSISRLLENVENSLRTFMNFKPGVLSSFLTLPKLWEHKSLRAVDLSGVPKLDLSSIGALNHLRYLNLSHTDIRKLDDSICRLYNLEVLKLNGCQMLEALPESIGRLKRLTHLYLNGCSGLTSMPQSMGELDLLSTLSLVIVGDGNTSDFQLSQLGLLNGLKGNLTISRLERVSNVTQARQANLIAKEGLCKLVLNWGSAGDEDGEVQSLVLENLKPFTNLKELEVSGYRGKTFPTWMMADFENFASIEFVQLSSCKNISQLPPLWKLPYLKRLYLSNLESLTSLIGGPEVRAFKSLQRVTMAQLPNLERIILIEGEKQDADIFPHVSHLEIDQCGQLPHQMFQELKSLRELSISGCSELRFLPDCLKLLFSLERLSIDKCPNVISFPDSIGELEKLTHLSITSCPALEKQCEKGTGEDWHKISRVLNIVLGECYIRREND